MVEVSEYDANSPLIFGATNLTSQASVTDIPAGKIAGEGAGSSIPGLSMTCVVACNCCHHDNGDESDNAFSNGDIGSERAAILCNNTNDITIINSSEEDD